MDKIQLYFMSLAGARKTLSMQMKSPFSNIAKDYPSFEWKVKSIKLSVGSKRNTGGYKLYDVVFEKKKRPNLKGHPFRGK